MSQHISLRRHEIPASPTEVFGTLHENDLVETERQQIERVLDRISTSRTWPRLDRRLIQTLLRNATTRRSSDLATFDPVDVRRYIILLADYGLLKATVTEQVKGECYPRRLAVESITPAGRRYLEQTGPPVGNPLGAS